MSKCGNCAEIGEPGEQGRRHHQCPPALRLITLKVVLPTAEEPELAAFLETWHPRNPQDPRKELVS